MRGFSCTASKGDIFRPFLLATLILSNYSLVSCVTLIARVPLHSSQAIMIGRVDGRMSLTSQPRGMARCFTPEVSYYEAGRAHKKHEPDCSTSFKRGEAFSCPLNMGVIEVLEVRFMWTTCVVEPYGKVSFADMYVMICR